LPQSALGYCCCCFLVVKDKTFSLTICFTTQYTSATSFPMLRPDCFRALMSVQHDLCQYLSPSQALDITQQQTESMDDACISNLSTGVCQVLSFQWIQPNLCGSISSHCLGAITSLASGKRECLFSLLLARCCCCCCCCCS
jgi:hypothetical protein